MMTSWGTAEPAKANLASEDCSRVSPFRRLLGSRYIIFEFEFYNDPLLLNMS